MAGSASTHSATHTAPSAATPDAFVVGLLAELESDRDPRTALMRLRQHLEACRRDGRCPPETLMRIEKQLAIECMAESQGR